MQPNRLSGLDKKALRREILAQRAGLSLAFVARASQAVAERLEALPPFAAAHEILAYLPIRKEVDVAIVVERLLEAGRRVLLPRCRSDAPGLLDIGCIACLDDVTPGRFGILEPREALCHPPEAFAPDVILTPGVAFDPKGTRLGFGGGYYDRLLAQPMAAHACVLGLAYTFQIVPSLPVEPWDRPMDAIITEQKIYRITL